MSGGQLVRRDPAGRGASPYAEPPHFRLSHPLDLYGNAGCVVLMRQAAALVNADPDVKWVEVAVREFAGNKYIIAAPTTNKNPRKESLTAKPEGGGAFIRTADDVLMAAGITSIPGRAYKMAAVLIEDDEFGWVVAANWTQAELEAAEGPSKA